MVCKQSLMRLEVLLLKVGEECVRLSGGELGGLLGGLGEGEGAVVVRVFVDLPVPLACGHHKTLVS